MKSCMMQKKGEGDIGASYMREEKATRAGVAFGAIYSLLHNWLLGFLATTLRMHCS